MQVRMRVCVRISGAGALLGWWLGGSGDGCSRGSQASGTSLPFWCASVALVGNNVAPSLCNDPVGRGIGRGWQGLSVVRASFVHCAAFLRETQRHKAAGIRKHDRELDMLLRTF